MICVKDNFLEKVKISDLIKINFDKFNKNKNLILKTLLFSFYLLFF